MKSKMSAMRRPSPHPADTRGRILSAISSFPPPRIEDRNAQPCANPLYDPPGPDAPKTIAEAQARGIEVKMITGDGANEAPPWSGAGGAYRYAEKVGGVIFSGGHVPPNLVCEMEM
jgi:hypothetical protein